MAQIPQNVFLVCYISPISPESPGMDFRQILQSASSRGCNYRRHTCWAIC